MASTTMTLEVDDQNENPIMVKIEVDYEMSRYHPAYTSGPPESCCPAEGGEIEINSIEILEVDGADCLANDDLRTWLLETYNEKIEEKCFESGVENYYD